MENFGLGAPRKITEKINRDLEDFPELSRESAPGGDESEWLRFNYGDDKIHIIDLRNREKVFELLNVPQQVGSLQQQTNQLLSTFV